MQRVRIEVVRSSRWKSADGFQVYGDGGSGVVDWTRPLTARRMRFWEDLPAMADHLLAGHVRGQHVDGVMPDRHGDETWLLDEHLKPAGVVAWESRPVVFGRFRFAVVTEDAAGNASTGGVVVHEVVVNSEPAPAGRLRPESFDPATGRLTLRFEPSLRLTG